MPEKTKQDETDEKASAADNSKQKDEDNCIEDQDGKSYYYDDSYGYEVYNPDEDEDENDGQKQVCSEAFKSI